MTTCSPVRRWYVVRTHPFSEAKAFAHLVRQGYEAYLPCYLKRRSHARRVETVAAPLFPRYLFVAVDIATQRWRAIGSTFGVAQLVCRGGEPAPVADHVVEDLRGREDEKGFITLPIRPRFVMGDKVQLLEGAMTGCVALFEDMKDSERVSVLLELLGRKVRTVLRADMIAAV
jgi:transcriptional antiterminator RfaH